MYATDYLFAHHKTFLQQPLAHGTQ